MNIIEKKVMSADKKYLVNGIIFSFLALAVVAMGIYHFTYTPLWDAVGLMFILIIPTGVCLLFAFGYLGAWRRREEFSIYYSPFEDGIPEDSVLSKYARVDVTMSYFVFVDEENLSLYSDWHLMNGADTLIDDLEIDEEVKGA